MGDALQGDFCDCCGRKCPLSNPGCGIGEDEAQRVLAERRAWDAHLFEAPPKTRKSS